MSRPVPVFLVAISVLFAGCAAIVEEGAGGANLPGLFVAAPELTAREIVRKAHEAAGGETWVRPSTLKMTGYGVFYRGGKTSVYDEYTMLRAYPGAKEDAHAADGKVRIEGKMDGRTAFIIAFDGETTYDMKGPVADQSANAQWASNFGFGSIRHALDDGWSQTRLPDDLVDGRLAHFVELGDPAGGVTRFGIDADTFAILYAGFDTPRGWHERRYSAFFEKSGVSWVQPGRVRLFYDGVKQNEIIWTDFDVNISLDDVQFAVQPE
ncbi:MAG: hypothetical protein GC152_08555 [Alphaproteobacteria bacterium]|nr:hypothetical protein [Alphaproteobacteria bacterium]